MFNAKIRVSVVIPTKNGGELFREVLRRVLLQETDFPFEVIAIDSGSTDGTYEYLKEQFYTFPYLRVSPIEPDTYGHGRTRNLGIEQAQGEYVAFITQDAMPSKPKWLQLLVDHIESDPAIAGVFGRHKPYPGHDPVEQRLIREHFARFGKSKRTWIIKDREVYEGSKGEYIFFSNNNSILRRSVAQRIPFHDIEMAEDQAWAEDILEAGWKKGYEPDAIVYHSHRYRSYDQFRRVFDEFRSYRHLLGIPALKEEDIKRVAKEYWEQAKDCIEHEVPSPVQRVRWLLHHFFVSRLKAKARYFGLSFDSLPKHMRNAISFQESIKRGQQKDVLNGPRIRSLRNVRFLANLGDLPIDLPRAVRGIWTRTRNDTEATRIIESLHNEWYSSVSRAWQKGWRQPSVLADRRDWKALEIFRAADLGDEFLRNFNERKEAERKENTGKLAINWMVPDIRPGGGGLMTISRFMAELGERGHQQALIICNRAGSGTVASIRDIWSKYYSNVDNLRILLKEEEIPGSDIDVATSWETAYTVWARTDTKLKAYFIQDYEPMFYERSSAYVFADNTYRMGFLSVCAGPWLERLLREKYGVKARSFLLGINRDEFYRINDVARIENTIAVYIRATTGRRGFELVTLALEEVRRQRPEVKIIVFGAERTEHSLPFEHEDLGVLGHAELCKLYNEVRAVVVLSLTNYSLLPTEVLACETPVIDIGDMASEEIYKGLGMPVLLAESTPIGIARKMLEVIDMDIGIWKQANRKYFSTQDRFDWKRQTKQVCDYLEKQFRQ